MGKGGERGGGSNSTIMTLSEAIMGTHLQVCLFSLLLLFTTNGI